MEGVYLLQPNGNITSLLSGYSKNFEEEAFKEFGDKTQQFGQLFNSDFVEVCNRRVFSFNVGEGTRLSLVFNKHTPPLDDTPDPTALFRVAFKSFTVRLVPKINSSPETEAELAGEYHKMMLVEGGGQAVPPADLLRSSELLLQLAFDYENFVATQSDPVFSAEDWQIMLRTFKDNIRIAAVRSSCRLAAELSSVQDQLAHVQQAFEASRSLQEQREKRIDVLSKAVQTLSVHLEKSEHCETSNSSHLSVSTSSPTTVNNRLLEAEDKKLVSTAKTNETERSCVEGEEKNLSYDRGEVNTDSNPVDAEEANAKVANELEKLMLASKHAIFYLQRDLEAIKLERESYYHQVLELRRARRVYETRRHPELENIPPAEPPDGFQKKKKLKAKDVSASTNGTTNILNGQAG